MTWSSSFLCPIFESTNISGSVSGAIGLFRPSAIIFLYLVASLQLFHDLTAQFCNHTYKNVIVSYLDCRHRYIVTKLYERFVEASCLSTLRK